MAKVVLHHVSSWLSKWERQLVAPEEERRVVLVRFHIKGEVLGENPRHVVRRTSVIVCAGITHRQEGTVPSPRVVKDGGEYQEEEDNANESVGNSVPAPMLAVYMTVDPRSTYHGGIRGEPTNPEICVQSRVNGISDRPVEYPKIWLTIGLLGAIQVTKANELRN